MAGVLSRRALVGAGLGVPWLSHGRALAQESSDAEIAERMLEALEVDPLTVFGSQASTPSERNKLLQRIIGFSPQQSLAEPSWPRWDASIDFVPGLRPATSASVEVSSDLLLACARRFNLPVGAGPRVLFGVRGAQLSSAYEPGRWASRLSLSLLAPDHRNMNCVIGVLDTQKREVAAFRGSTVPEVAHIRTNLMQIGGCNTPVPGRYSYRVGLHGVSKGFKQPGALIQSGSIVVLRTTRVPTYDVKDQDCFWDVLSSTSNLHSAVFTGANSRSPLFSSAGCQIVQGSYDRTRGWVPTGQYAAFRRAAGLADIPSPNDELATADDGKVFTYLLFGGADLAFETAGAFGAGQYLRLGATGTAVRQLQTRLGRQASGTFDAKTLIASLEDQKSAGLQEYPSVVAD
jgi:hypothetical protein